MSALKLIGMSLAELAEAYASRSLSPVEVVNDVITHAEAVNGSINALFCFRPEQAIAGARQSEARWKAKAALGPLDGVPMTVKDSVAMVGWPYFHGIGANRSLPPSNYDSPPAIALREAGAVIFAKTTMPDCGLLASGISSLHGITRNPWGLAWNTGGSSAGAGASVAAGAGFVSVGTDIAGSVRLPAAHCGLASLKPTHGRVPHLPADTMRMAGPMGRSVDDIARLLTVLARQDERDTWSLPADGVRYHERLGRDVKGLKIGILTDMGFGSKPEAEVRNAVEGAGRLLAGLGAIVEPFVSPLDYDAYAPIDLFLQVRGYLEYNSLPPHTRQRERNQPLCARMVPWRRATFRRRPLSGAWTNRQDEVGAARCLRRLGLCHCSDAACGELPGRRAGRFAPKAPRAYAVHRDVQSDLPARLDGLHGIRPPASSDRDPGHWPSVQRPRRIAGDENSGRAAIPDNGLAVSAARLKWRRRKRL
jgi:Asp-tRNA(Asn)/Glu-tRNA(Gln) amidotransferase A subunit family amidase